MGEPLRIGVLGSSSGVARMAVLPAIEASANAVVQATASLSDSSADYGDYESLLADSSVEAVYLPLPNSLHRQWTERAAAAGKHVLCEKPLAVNAPEAAQMAAACAEAGVVLMEAYMTAFHPRDILLGELLDTGRLGRLVSAHSEFTGFLGRPDDHRWHPEMGGGALLDLGIYCLTPLLRAGGLPPGGIEKVRLVAGSAHRNEFGVDSSFSGWLDFGEGVSASFCCSFEAPERQVVSIVGTKGRVEIERAFTPGLEDRQIELVATDGSRESLSVDGLNPYQAMVEHFAAVVRQEEELRRPPAVSVGLQRLVDRLAYEAQPGAT